jgi:hypothetical protein
VKRSEPSVVVFGDPSSSARLRMTVENGLK